MVKYTKESISKIMDQRLSGETLVDLSNRMGIKKATLSYWIAKSKKEDQSLDKGGAFESITIQSINKSTNSIILIQRENTILEFSTIPSAEYVKTLLGW
jgi:hypothetical protein